MRKYENALMVYMFIDTDNKTIEQVKCEVINRVEAEFHVKLIEAKASMGNDEYDLVKSILEIEKIKILRSYLNQIDKKMGHRVDTKV